MRGTTRRCAPSTLDALAHGTRTGLHRQSRGKRRPRTITVSLERAPSGEPMLYVPCPGGHMKFHIVFDSKMRLYGSFPPQSTDSMTRPERLPAERYNLPNNERHRLALHFSKNCVDWCYAGLVAVGGSARQARHYASAVIDGDDLHVLSRSGDERAITPRRQHDHLPHCPPFSLFGVLSLSEFEAAERVDQFRPFHERRCQARPRRAFASAAVRERCLECGPRRKRPGSVRRGPRKTAPARVSIGTCPAALRISISPLTHGPK
jgi:hypothetical protein